MSRRLAAGLISRASAILRLNEDVTKGWLRSRGLPVPRGAVATSPDEAAQAFRDLGGACVVKALVPANRRGKAGGVIIVDDAAGAAGAARNLLGSRISGHLVRKVFVEAHADIAEELYLAYAVSEREVRLLVSSRGGVDIESLADSHPLALVSAAVASLKGVSPQFAAEQWRRAGVQDERLPALADLTSQLYDAFVAADATLLEINPLAWSRAGEACIVGALMSIDEHALFRHREWIDESADDQLPENPRERRVALVNRDVPGGECQYVELDGDIGLLVGGGGPGLYQHDLMLELGGRPANHSVTPPTGSDNRKLKAVIEAIFDHPHLKALLVGFNFAQMARTDIRVRTLVEVLEEKRIDTRKMPIVIRLFGAGEAQSRAMVAGKPNVHYVPRGTSLREAVQLVIRLTRGDAAGRLA